MIFQGPEFYIDTAEVILSDLRDSGAETTENLKNQA